MSPNELKTCHCEDIHPHMIKQSGAKPRKTARSLPAILLSILIAFFPKCPLCLAAYLSMFGSFGLAYTPYLKWVYPLLILFLGLHLLLLLRKAGRNGYGPFMLSLAGSIMILGGRALLPDNEPVLLAGMLFILSGSLWNSFSINRFKTSISN